MLDDGKIRMRVIEKKKDQISAEVLVGGALASRKGISLPDTLLPIGPLTEKDEADLECALDLGVDWIALSFVQRAEDVRDVVKRSGTLGHRLVKIEKPSAVADLDSIICRRRRLHGCARRSRRRDAGREGARPAEADHAQGPRRR